MPGDTQEKKFANLRTAYGFMMGHPGKKLLFMGQDFGQMDEWNEKASLEWGLLKYDIHSQMKDYVKALNHLYRTQPALYKMDYEPEGFEWINCTYNDENIVIFERKTDKAGRDVALCLQLSLRWNMRNSASAFRLPESTRRS